MTGHFPCCRQGGGLIDVGARKRVVAARRERRGSRAAGWRGFPATVRQRDGAAVQQAGVVGQRDGLVGVKRMEGSSSEICAAQRKCPARMVRWLDLAVSIRGSMADMWGAAASRATVVKARGEMKE